METLLRSWCLNNLDMVLAGSRQQIIAEVSQLLKTVILQQDEMMLRLLGMTGNLKHKQITEAALLLAFRLGNWHIWSLLIELLPEGFQVGTQTKIQLREQVRTWNSIDSQPSVVEHPESSQQALLWLLRQPFLDFDEDLLRGLIHLCAREGFVECLDHLITACSDCIVPDEQGYTALYQACLHGHTEAVQILLPHYNLQNLNHMALDSTTALDAAHKGLHGAIIALLLQKGAKSRFIEECFLIPVRPIPEFVGRQRTLNALHRWYNNTTPSLYSLIGLGGTGKSQIAARFAYQLRELKPLVAVCWIDASDAVRFEENHRLLVQELRLSSQEGATVFETFYSWLFSARNARRGFPNLLIYDNLHSLETLRYLPRRFHPILDLDARFQGRLLITTRSTSFTAYGAFFRIGQMSHDDATELFRKHIDSEPSPATPSNRDASQVEDESFWDRFFREERLYNVALKSRPETISRTEMAKFFSQQSGTSCPPQTLTDLLVRLDYHPLALQNAFSYMKEHKIPPGDYLQLLNRTKLSDDFDDLVGSTLSASLDQLRSTDRPAFIFLATICHFEHTRIPISILFDVSWELDAQIRRLYAIGLVQHLLDPMNSLAIQPVVQRCMLRYLQKTGLLDDAAERALNLLNQKFPEHSFETKNITAALIPHAYHVSRKQGPGNPSSKAILVLKWRLAQALSGWGKYQAAIDIFMYIRFTTKKYFPTSSSKVTLGLGEAYLRLGNYKKAEAAFQALLKDEGASETDFSRRQIPIVDKIASTYRASGRYNEAQQLQELVVEKAKQELGSEHPDTLTCMSNLAAVYGLQGRWHEAEILESLVIERATRNFGKYHPDVLGSMSNLAAIHSLAGDWERAENLAVEVVLGNKIAFGREHPHTLASTSGLGRVLLHKGKLLEAEAIYKRLITLQFKVLGPRHPGTLLSMNNLGIIRCRRGHWQDAENIFREIIPLRSKTLGDQHPDTLASVHNLGVALFRQAWFEEARSVLQWVIHAQTKVLGEGHPNTKTSVGAMMQYHRLVQLARRGEREHQELNTNGSRIYGQLAMCLSSSE
ncbi:TPR-like protein [Myriangium duriaei CBS 260.36]|uniref:TPR-like protein n=1 Tax=Myriangium duriaei CBS 260.36 TaxID=1168546 RepID=A0A9P4IXU2_9PEZI|nr:TPR-like protein [Myriangium duriaei CBS 260.36]